MSKRQQQFQERIMEKFPVGAGALFPHGAKAEILFHTCNMRAEVDGLRVKFADGRVEDVRYGDIEQASWTDEAGFHHLESLDASLVALPEDEEE